MKFFLMMWFIVSIFGARLGAKVRVRFPSHSISKLKFLQLSYTSIQPNQKIEIDKKNIFIKYLIIKDEIIEVKCV